MCTLIISSPARPLITWCTALKAGTTGALHNRVDHAVRLVGGPEDVGLAGVVLVLDAELGQVHGDVVDVGLCVRARVCVCMLIYECRKEERTMRMRISTQITRETTSSSTYLHLSTPTYHIKLHLLHPRNLAQDPHAHVIQRLLHRHTIHALIRWPGKLINQSIQHLLV